MFFRLNPAARQSTRRIDLNLLPPEYQPRPFPMLTVGLVLLIVGGFILAYAAFWLSLDSGRKLRDWEERAVQAELVIQNAVASTSDSISLEKADEYRQDYLLLQRRQIRWGDVLHVILNVPEGLVVDSITQSAFTVQLEGRANDSAIANDYLTRLRSSGLFEQPQIQLEQIPSLPVILPPPDSPTATPFDDITHAETTIVPVDTATEVQPTDSPSLTPSIEVTPRPTLTASVTPTDTPPSPTPPPPPPSPTARPQPPTPTLRPTDTFTATPTNTITTVPTSTVTPTPEFDFALVAQSSTQIEDHRTSHIRATILDENGNRIAGVAFRVESQGFPPWSSEKPEPGLRDGTVEFAVTKGVFTVRPLVEGRVQIATGLVTGQGDLAGKQEWQLVWRKTHPGGPLLGPPTITPTVTLTPPPSATPRWPGRNLARLGSVTASGGQDSARHAIDGNVETIWQSGGFPVQELVITLNDFYDKNSIDGLELVVAQSSVGRTTHEIWVEDETGQIRSHTSELNADTRDRQTLVINWDPGRLGTGLTVKRVFVRTIRGPSWVGWREVRIYEKLPPPRSTATPTRTATVCPVAACTATPTIPPTATATGTPTDTATPSPTDTGTATASGTATETQIPTSTPTHTFTPTATPTPSDTTTSTSTPTPTPPFTPEPGELFRYTGVGPRNTPPFSAGSSPLLLRYMAMWDGEFRVLLGADVVIDRDASIPVQAGRIYEDYIFPAGQNHFTISVADPTEEWALWVLEIPPTSTATPSFTSTATPTPTATPLGLNVASLGSASASNGAGSAQLAIDGNAETLWEAGVGAPPSQFIQIDLDGLRTVDAIALVAGQTLPGSTTHQVLVQDQSGSLLLVGTIVGETTDRQTLEVSLVPALVINKVIVETLEAPGFVAWREIIISEQVVSASIPSSDSDRGPVSALSTQGDHSLGQSHRPAGAFGQIIDLLQTLFAPSAEALAAPAAQTPVDGSAGGPVRFSLLLELKPGEGYFTK